MKQIDEALSKLRAGTQTLPKHIRCNAIGQIVAALESVGFTVDGMSPDGLAHRCIRPAKAQPVNAPSTPTPANKRGCRCVTLTFADIRAVPAGG